MDNVATSVQPDLIRALSIGSNFHRLEITITREDVPLLGHTAPGSWPKAAELGT